MADREGFSVVDVETTGFSPKRNDRIVEIAIIRMDAKGAIQEEYDTLVNPDRDVGPTFVHGIKPRDVKNAPYFEDVVGDVLALMRDTVFVAHNVTFDLNFVRAELARVGVELPEVPLLCTMDVAAILDPNIPCRKLSVICEYFGIPNQSNHHALSDAKASAWLLTTYLKQLSTGELQIIEDDENRINPSRAKMTWPSRPRTGKRFPRLMTETVDQQTTTFLSRILAKLPSYRDVTPKTNAYLMCLDRAIDDRHLSADEAADLEALAEKLGLLREQVELVHRRYLSDLARAALEDGQLSSIEMSDLEDVSRLLGYSHSDLENVLGANGYQLRPTTVHQKESVEETSLLQGKLICFTGQFRPPVSGEVSGREIAEKLALKYGMIIKEHVVKSLDFLVAADVETMSGKAKRAREYGVKIISEDAFWKMIGVELLPGNATRAVTPETHSAPSR